MVLGSKTLGAKALGDYQLPRQLPTFGAVPFGRLPFGGGSMASGVALPSIFSPVGHDAVADLVIGQMVTLYELITPAGAVYRVADFADPEASSTLGQVTFNGDEYLSIRITRPKLAESIAGRLPTIDLALHDPQHALLTWVLANDLLRNAKLNLHIIHYEDLSDPSLAITRTYRVRKVSALEGPPRVQIQFGAPNLTDLQFPVIEYARLGCHNNFNVRHQHDGLNYCNYPSDEYEDDTKQIFQVASDAEIEGEHGWFVVNADKLNGTSTLGDLHTASPDGSGGTSDLSLKFRKFSRQNDYVQDDTKSNAPFVFKKIVDAPSDPDNPSDADIDVYAKLENKNISADKTCVAIMVQSIDDPDNWILFGLENYQLTSPYYRHQCRVTTNGVSVDTTYAGTSSVHRIARSGNSWKVYTADENYDQSVPLSAYSWTEHGTHTLAITGDVRVGVCLHSDDSATLTVTSWAHAYYFRYLAGGYQSCERTISACDLRKNLLHRNALEGLPDVIVF